MMGIQRKLALESIAFALDEIKNEIRSCVNDVMEPECAADIEHLAVAMKILADAFCKIERGK